jgi:hypothetical protein
MDKTVKRLTVLNIILLAVLVAGFGPAVIIGYGNWMGPFGTAAKLKMEVSAGETYTNAVEIKNRGTTTNAVDLTGTFTNGINLSGATVTSDIVLENSDTITNADANTIKVSDKFCLENDECFDNGTNGTVAMVGVMDVTSITLGNDETITNAVDGAIVVDGSLDITAAGGLILSNDETITNAVDGAVVCDGTFDITAAGGLILSSDDTITNPDANTVKISDKLCLENDECLDNGTDGQIEFGEIELHDFQVETDSTAGAWSATNTCDSGIVGSIIFADDSTDTQIGEICACLFTDPATYAWINLADGSACAP